MNLNMSNAEISLSESQFLTLSEAQGVRIECLTGSLWLTQNGDRRDVVLESGEGFTLDRPGQALIFAGAPAKVAIQSSVNWERRSTWKRAIDAIGVWVSRFREPDYATNVFRQYPAIKQALPG